MRCYAEDAVGIQCCLGRHFGVGKKIEAFGFTFQRMIFRHVPAGLTIKPNRCVGYFAPVTGFDKYFL